MGPRDRGAEGPRLAGEAVEGGRVHGTAFSVGTGDSRSHEGTKPRSHEGLLVGGGGWWGMAN